METKWIGESKLFWLGAASILLGAFGLWLSDPLRVIFATQGFAIIGLRKVTSKSVRWKK